MTWGSELLAEPGTRRIKENIRVSFTGPVQMERSVKQRCSMGIQISTGLSHKRQMMIDIIARQPTRWMLAAFLYSLCPNHKAVDWYQSVGQLVPGHTTERIKTLFLCHLILFSVKSFVLKLTGFFPNYLCSSLLTYFPSATKRFFFHLRKLPTTRCAVTAQSCVF